MNETRVHCTQQLTESITQYTPLSTRIMAQDTAILHICASSRHSRQDLARCTAIVRLAKILLFGLCANRDVLCICQVVFSFLPHKHDESQQFGGI